MSHCEGDRTDGRGQCPTQPGQRRAETEHESVDPTNWDSHVHGGLVVLLRSSSPKPVPRPFQEPHETENYQSRENRAKDTIERVITSDERDVVRDWVGNAPGN